MSYQVLSCDVLEQRLVPNGSWVPIAESLAPIQLLVTSSELRVVRRFHLEERDHDTDKWRRIATSDTKPILDKVILTELIDTADLSIPDAKKT